MCENALGFLGPSVVVPLLREMPEEGKVHSWRHILGRLNYVQLLLTRYEFSANGCMTPRDVVSVLTVFDAGMHSHPAVRDQAKLLCGIVVEHENEVEKRLKESGGNGGKNGAMKHLSSHGGADSRAYPPGHRAKMTLEPFIDTLHGDRRAEFEEDLFGEAPIRNYRFGDNPKENASGDSSAAQESKKNRKKKRMKKQKQASDDSGGKEDSTAENTSGSDKAPSTVEPSAATVERLTQRRFPMR